MLLPYEASRAAEPGMRPHDDVATMLCSPHWAQNACKEWESTGVKTQTRFTQRNKPHSCGKSHRTSVYPGAAATNWAQHGHQSSSKWHRAEKSPPKAWLPSTRLKTPGKLHICLVLPGQLPQATKKGTFQRMNDSPDQQEKVLGMGIFWSAALVRARNFFAP